MSENLAVYRTRIDKIDAELTELLDARFHITAQIGQYKKAYGLPILDKERERAMQARQAYELEGSRQKRYIVVVWMAILAQSKQQQADLLEDEQ